jgi:predicted DNA-binding transcriptional regulator AlpA
LASVTDIKPQKAPPAVQPPALPATGFVRMADLVNFVPVDPATIWRWIKEKKFPAPVSLGNRTTAWRCEDVRKWILEHPAEQEE